MTIQKRYTSSPKCCQIETDPTLNTSRVCFAQERTQKEIKYTSFNGFFCLALNLCTHDIANLLGSTVLN